jgi:putative transposase
MRWHAHYHTSGTGHLYQGRFKAFPVEADDHFLTVLRYVERNALRANLVQAAEDWRWGSLWRRVRGSETSALLSDSPVSLPRNWRHLVNAAQTEPELEGLRRSVTRGMPYGSEEWTKRVVRRLGLEWTIRPRGRPRRTPAE